LGCLQNEIDNVKQHRAELWRDIQKLNDTCDRKTHDAGLQAEKLHALASEIARVHAKIDDLARQIEQRNHDLHNKKHSLEETQRELERAKDTNCKTASDVGTMKSNNQRLGDENH
jgi:predicted  nucleic acid-binding Zn-ribbon protein